MCTTEERLKRKATEEKLAKLANHATTEGKLLSDVVGVVDIRFVAKRKRVCGLNTFNK